MLALSSPQRQLLQSRRETGAVQQSEAEHHGQQVWRPDAEVLLEPAVVVEALVDHADGDQGIDEKVGPSDLQQGRKDQRDAVAQRECRDEFRNVPAGGEEERDTE